MSKITKDIEEARKLLDDALEAMEEADTRIQSLPDDTPDEERQFHAQVFASRQEDVDRRREHLERLVALRDARAAVPPVDDAEASRPVNQDEQRGRPRVSVGKEPLTYRLGGPFQYFRDLHDAQIHGDEAARARINQHGREMVMEGRVPEGGHEIRTMSTTATAGGNFIPPQYLGEMYAGMARPGRPFADAVPSSPLATTGMSFTIPRITTGSLVAVQTTQNTSLGTQDIVEALLTVPVVTIGGYSDLSVQLAERSDPAFDQILFNDLRQDYDRLLDYQLINGTGTTQHVGIRSVSSIQTETYTATTPVVSGLYPKIYEAVSKITTTRYAEPDLILAHPRRSAWLASYLSSTLPIFQVRNLYQAAGQQNAVQGVLDFAGLPVVNDPNIITTGGTGTNEDEMYVVRTADMHLWEGPIRVEVFRDVGSATGTVRVRLYAYSAFASGRFPNSICKVSGSGLAAPTF